MFVLCNCRCEACPMLLSRLRDATGTTMAPGIRGGNRIDGFGARTGHQHALPGLVHHEIAGKGTIRKRSSRNHFSFAVEHPHRIGPRQTHPQQAVVVDVDAVGPGRSVKTCEAADLGGLAGDGQWCSPHAVVPRHRHIEFRAVGADPQPVGAGQSLQHATQVALVPAIDAP